MLKSSIFFLLFWASFNFTFARPIIDFEESIIHAGGSIWGTEGSLKESLNIPESQIPGLFQIRQKPIQQVAVPYHLAGPHPLFRNGQANVYEQLNLCVQPDTELYSQELLQAVDDFRTQLTSLNGKERLQFQVINSFNADHCHILFVRGQEQEFPYKQIFALLGNHTQWTNQVYAIYYQKTSQHIPIVVLHPKAKITFEMGPQPYVRFDQNLFLIEGRSLFLHEIGHLLGFEHIPNHLADGSTPDLSVMGRVNTERVERDLQLRFREAYNIWQIWDQRQIHAYRKLLWNNHKPGLDRNHVCFNKNESFVIQGPIMQHTKPSQQRGSFILTNLSPGQIDLSPWKLLSDSQSYHFNEIYDLVLSSEFHFLFNKLRFIEIQNFNSYWRPLFHMNPMETLSDGGVVFTAAVKKNGYKTSKASYYLFRDFPSDCP